MDPGAELEADSLDTGSQAPSAGLDLVHKSSQLTHGEYHQTFTNSEVFSHLG